MSKFGFTLEPWQAYITDGIIEVQSDKDPKPVISWMGFDEGDRDLSEHEANAHLIASAPDLLSSLMVLLDCIEDELPTAMIGAVVPSNVIKNAKAAINKAGGK